MVKNELRFSFICLVLVATICVVSGCKKCDSGLEDDENNMPEFVDLGFPSGTIWKSANESGLYTFDSAVARFTSQLPTIYQYLELLENCTYRWDEKRKGAVFVSNINGDSIFMPAAGYRDCSGNMDLVGSNGYYWSCTLDGSGGGSYIFFYQGIATTSIGNRCGGRSVRLVKTDCSKIMP